MGSDKARLTYDPKQQYRSVVMQQGRVTLEADWNEAAQITHEETRQQALEIVGPCGTPDNGYQILPGGNYDFSVSQGTMYVGGIRAHLPNAIFYNSQPDWLNYNNSPDPQDLSDDAVYWAEPGAPAPVQLGGGQGVSTSGATNEFIYLYLREQEVSAVEDPNLAEVALGGPDTAARARLLQHIVRVGSGGSDCASGMSAAQAQWLSQGISFDSASMRLQSEGTLLVGFSDQGQTSTPCQPQAQGGYLDPDNQLIRVQISGIDPMTGNPTFIWGFDNASFLYRISITDAETISLQSTPVDTNHQPVSGQAVEILRSAAELDNPGAYVAALSGFVVTLDQNYNPDSNSIQLPKGASFPAEYLTSNQSPPAALYLRVWQQQVVFIPGEAIPLGDTGLLVTLQSSTTFHTGDYWQFAVRPSTPQNIYPQRYQNSPQPPDGPRLWVCPLAVISWNGSTGTIVSDCRPKFGPLASRALHITGINWPNDDLVSLPAFRNNPLQVNFDYPPSALSVSDSTMTVAVEVPYPPALNLNFLGQADAAKVSTSSSAASTGAKLSSRAAISRPVSIGVSKTGIAISTAGLGSPGIFRPIDLPNNLLAGYQSAISAAASVPLPSVPASMQGYIASIQPGNPTVASGAVSWSRQLSTADFVPYLSTVSLSAIGAQLRVRVAMKGRDIRSAASNPLVYLDGQVFGEPGQRADGTTPCTNLMLPSGTDARASDFESWFWLSLFVWSQTDYSVGDLPLCLATGDFNGDGAQDIAVATLSGGIVILVNDGNGGFTAKAIGQIGEWPLSIVAADFNNDGFMDLAVTSYSNGTVTVLLGSANGTFSALPAISVGNGPWAIAAADFNGDGLDDLAVTNAEDGTVSILMNNAGESFTPFPGSPIQVGTGTIPIGLVAVDLNGDGHSDLAVLNAGNNTVSLFAGNGQGGFVTPAFLILNLPAASTPPAAGSALPLSITTADFNNDGHADLAIGGIYLEGTAPNSTPNSYVAIFSNDSTGSGKFNTFAYPTLHVTGLPASLAVANLDPTNPTGNVDLIATGASFLGGTSNFSILVGNGDGTFQNPVVYPVKGNVNPIAVVSADFNGDGIPDLAMTTEGGNVSVLLNEQAQVTSRVVINQVTPAGAVSPGEQIQLIGRNFGVPDLNNITIAGVPVTTINAALSSDTVLALTVPAITGIPAQGQKATLTLSNPNGFASIAISLSPGRPTLPQGNLYVAMSLTAPVTTVSAGQALIFQFEVKGNASQNETYSVKPVVDLGWPAALVTASGITIVPPQIPLALDANGDFDSFFYVSVAIPGGVANKVTGNLTVAVASVLNPGQLNNTSLPLPIQVGSAPPLPQNAIIVGYDDVVNAQVNASHTVVTVTAGSQAAIDLTAITQGAGSYDVQVPTVGTPAGWTIAIAHATAAGDLPFTTTASNLSQPIRILVTGAAGAAATTLTVTVVSTTQASITGQLQLTVQIG